LTLQSSPAQAEQPRGAFDVVERFCDASPYDLASSFDAGPRRSAQRHSAKIGKSGPIGKRRFPGGRLAEQATWKN
jgi:hypothetical protein